MKLLISLNGEVKEFSPDPNLGIITIGRADSNDVCLKGEKAASRQHLTLERTVDGWKMVDQMSANGTSLNGEKMNFAFIKDGDVIQVGATSIQITGLLPTPGAQGVSARPPRRADAPRGIPKRAAAAQEVEPGEARPFVGPVPRAKSPVPALVAVAVIILVLGAGGYFVVSNLGTAPQGVDSVADKGPDGPRQAELSDEEKAALSVARGVMDGDGTIIEKLNELERIQERLKGKRGSKAVSDISDMRGELARRLDREVNGHVELELKSVDLSVEEGNYVMAMQKLDDLGAYLTADPYLASMAKAHQIKIDRKRDDVENANRGFLALSFSQMWNYADQMRYDDAIAVCDDLLARAYLTAGDRDVYETERKKLEALKASIVPPAPEVKQDEEKKPSILDKVKKDNSRLPGKNPLLPDGARSEARLLADLQVRLEGAVKDGTLKGKRFKIRGNDAEIEGLSSTGRLKYLYAYIDKKTGEELVVPSSTTWDKIQPEDMLGLYDLTPNKSDEDNLALIIYCFENGFTDQAARRALSLYKERNDWKEGIDNLVASKRKINIPEGGFVEHDGMLVTPTEKDDAIFYANLRAVLERFEKGVGSKDRRKAEEAEVAFNELMEMGERAVKPAIEILQGVLDKEMVNAKKATGLMADDAKLKELMTELDRRRDYALELIMDPVAYPYPYAPNQAEIQAEVNERVAAVREIWDNPIKFAGQTNPQFDAVMEKIRAIAERMATIDPQQDYFKQTPEETVEYISNIANEALTIRNYTGDNSAKQKLYNANVKIMEYNENFPTGPAHADAESREQVKITNEYRIMFGRMALKINDKLFWAAHHHSRYCVEHNGGQIAHVIEGEPRGAAPADRMRTEGYMGGGGENIHMNSGGPTALSSHNSWCQSSGHHRNILTPGWRVLGSAKWQTIWTQKFGALDEGEGNSVSRGGE